MKSNLPINIEPLVKIKRNQVITTSLDVAGKFEKRHDTVLRAIRNLDCSDSFILRNFAGRKYLDDRGNRQPIYEMTRDGFSFLAMGFTGKKAAQWKEAFIDAFNSFENVLVNQANPAWQELRNQGKLVRIETTDTIKAFIEYAKKQGSKNAHHYYENISNATYKALFLTKQKSTNSFRDLLDGMQQTFLQTAEYVAINALKEGMQSNLHYKHIYQLCKFRLESLAKNVGVTEVGNTAQTMRLEENIEAA